MAMSRQIKQDVELALPSGPPGLTPREVHARVGFYARVSIRHVLRELVAEGRVYFAGADCSRNYWRRDAEATKSSIAAKIRDAMLDGDS